MYAVHAHCTWFGELHNMYTRIDEIGADDVRGASTHEKKSKGKH